MGTHDDAEPARRSRPKDPTLPGDMRLWCSMSVQRVLPAGSPVLVVSRCHFADGDDVTVMAGPRGTLRSHPLDATRSLSAHISSPVRKG